MKPALVAIIVIALLLSVALLGLGTPNRGWQLDNSQSQLSFISTKAKDVGEVHRFKDLEGWVADDGNVALIIKLASVDTLIPLRNERMRNMLFNVAQFPEAMLAGTIDLNAFNGLSVGESLRHSAEFLLDLNDQQTPIQADLLVSRLSRNKIQVASFQPVIVNAASFKLVGGIELLREAAGLPSISSAVPVSFVLTFSQP